MKKKIILFLALALAFALCATAAWADSAAMRLDSCEAEAGTEFSVPLRLVNNPGVISIELNVSYDANALEWIGVQAGDYGGTAGDYELGVGQSIAWFAKDERTDIAQDGVFATLSFRVKEGAQPQSTEIRVSFHEDDVFNADFENVDFAVVPGVVTVKAPAASFTVHFDTNGGENAPANQTVKQGEALTLPPASPMREDWLFLGWAESSGAENAQLQPGGQFTPNADTTLYAVWLDLSAPDFKLPASLQNVGDEAFAGTAVRFAVLPEGLSEIGNRVFSGCTRLVAVYAPALVTNILADAFNGTPDTLVLLGQIASAIAEFAAQYGFHFEAVNITPVS